MSYRCGICGKPAPDGQPRLVHVVHRHVPLLSLGKRRYRQEVDRELPVCVECKADLATGIPLAQVMAYRGKVVQVSLPVKVTPVVELQTRPMEPHKPLVLGKPTSGKPLPRPSVN